MDTLPLTVNAAPIDGATTSSRGGRHTDPDQHDPVDLESQVPATADIATTTSSYDGRTRFTVRKCAIVSILAADPESQGPSSQPRSSFCTRKIAIGCVGFAALVSALIAAGAVISIRLQANNSMVSAPPTTSVTYADHTPMATPTLNSMTPTATGGSEGRGSLSPPAVPLPTSSRAEDRSNDALEKDLTELAAAGNVDAETV